MHESSIATLKDYVKGSPPVPEHIPLVHVLPSVSLPQILESGEIRPTANSRVTKITKTAGGLCWGADGNFVPPDVESRLAQTDIVTELNTPMVHFSLGVPYYRPSHSVGKKSLGLFHSCALIFDDDSFTPDYVYGCDSGGFILGPNEGINDSPNLTLEGMKLGTIENARRYIQAIFGSSSAYLHGETEISIPSTTNPYAHYLYHHLCNPQHNINHAKEASFAVEVKSKKGVSLDKLRGIVMPAALILEPSIENFLIKHPKVKFRLYTTSPWVGPEECHAAVLNETYKLYREMGIDVSAQKSFFTDVGNAVARIKRGRTGEIERGS
jgi:hypothetical protein